jgi:diguanylate cyclase (GGDEF)-like protein
MKSDNRFTRWVANQPIQSKLTLINVAVIFVALTPVVGITLSYEYFAIRRSSLQEAEVQADIIRDNIAAATAFHDRNAAAETLGALQSSPNVLQAVVLLPHDEVLARYVKDEGAVVPIQKIDGLDGAAYSAAGILVSRVVYLRENVVGWLAVETSTRPLRERIGLYLLVNFLATLLGFVIALPLAKWLKETITGPLQVLMERAHHVTTHHDYSPPKVRNDSDDEIGHLSRAFDSMLSGIRQRDLKLSQMAYYDNVTGLANRHYFVERLQQAVSGTKRYGTRCCVMFIDLDNFKTVNDTFGHDVGDQLLREVATTLMSVSRDTDFVSRLGGDEFAIIVEDIKGLKGPIILAEKIIAALSQPMTIQGHPVQVGASIGVAACPDHATETADILRAADTAMYWAKEHGKNRYRVFDHDTAPD